LEASVGRNEPVDMENLPFLPRLQGFIYIYIYIYITYVWISRHIPYIYIYICIHRERERDYYLRKSTGAGFLSASL